MASYLSGLSPVNAFPDYHGPYSVGTVDVEIPVADLPSPCETPEGAQPTIAFRIFYPCVKPARDHERAVRWVPQPQRLSVAALIRFLGVKDRTASTLSYAMQQFYWIKIRAYRNAQMLDAPTTNGRWPVTVFSHGLAGSRNAYSYICGDLASNGMVVIALDHRDGSSPVQYVRATASTEARIIPTNKINHDANDEVFEARDKQLRIRLWEISMAYGALMKIDAGQKIENLDENTSSRRKERVEVLLPFKDTLNIHRPGQVTFCGHSFGAATMTQLVKAIYYSSELPNDAGKPLISPTAEAAIVQQITPHNPVLLLDLWCLPLKSPNQKWLWDRPLPSYAVGGCGGDNVLSVLSEGFHKWTQNLDANKHIIAVPSRSSRASAPATFTRESRRQLPNWARIKDESPSPDSGYASQASQSPSRSPARSSNVSRPHMFYVEKSQHFNQSDFGILFPWVTKRFAKAEEPERILELNTRAMVQVMRKSGIEVAGKDDGEILDPDAGIRRWNAVAIRNGDGSTY